MVRGISKHAALTLVALAGCHVVLGLEEAAEVVETSAGGGGSASCNAATQCDDDNPCTTDDCVDGDCQNTAVDDTDADAELQTDGDCQRVVCQGGVLETLEDGADIPVDDLECTDDLCDGDSPSNPAKSGGTSCTQDGGKVCNDSGGCVECYSNDDCTTPSTCGGNGVAGMCGCTPTFTCGSQTCGSFTDPVCLDVVNCNNGIKDVNESDVDCGGDVSLCNVRCNAGEMCVLNTDCATNNCGANNVCV